MHPSGTELAELGELIEQGKPKVIIDKTFPFEKVPGLSPMSKGGMPKAKSWLR